MNYFSNRPLARTTRVWLALESGKRRKARETRVSGEVAESHVQTARGPRDRIRGESPFREKRCERNCQLAKFKTLSRDLQWPQTQKIFALLVNPGSSDHALGRPPKAGALYLT